MQLINQFYHTGCRYCTRKHTHTHSCLHSQGHTDSAICSDKLQSETLVGLLFTFAHLKAPSIREGLSSHAGKVTHKGSECQIRTHTNAHARVCANATAVHTDEKLFVGSLEFCKHQAGLQTDNSLKLVYREFGALQTDIVGLN